MNSIGKQFMEMTKYKNMTERQNKGAQPPLEAVTEADGAITLPKPEEAPFSQANLLDIINARRSLRGYSEAALSAAEFSFLLWCCQGVKEAHPKHTLRTVPSAGARHAFETFILVNKVEGFQPGLYRYLAIKHAVLPVNLDDGVAELLTAGCLGQGMVATSAIAVFWTAELERMYYRYNERGYRYLHLDAGHACQNLMLAAEAIGCGACAIAAFDDDALNCALGLDGVDKFTVYVAALGKKPELK